MTEKRANEILKTKYPEARIYNGKRFGGSCAGNMVVTFSNGGKCYEYAAASYQQVLEKLGFNILYKHNVEALNKRAAELTEQIKNKGEVNKCHLFDKRDFIPYNENELKEKAAELEKIKNTLNEAIIV